MLKEGRETVEKTPSKKWYLGPEKAAEVPRDVCTLRVFCEWHSSLRDCRWGDRVKKVGFWPGQGKMNQLLSETQTKQTQHDC